MKKCFEAKSAKQLEGILKTVYMFNVPYEVKLPGIVNGIFIYEVWIEADEEKIKEIQDHMKIIYGR